MPRQSISKEQKIAEGRALAAYFELTQSIEPGLSQENLAAEIGVTQGLLSQWFSGRTPIPDKRLVWLGRRLNFDPAKIRPGLSYLSPPSDRQGRTKLNEVIDRIPPGEEDLYASILKGILDARLNNQQ